MNRKYEILLLLNHKMEKKDLEKLISNIETKIGGNIVKKEDWGIKKLAYKINKEDKAYYILYFIETTSENIASLKEFISITKNIIRPMILRHERKWPFEYKTAKELKFPERRPRTFGPKKPYIKNPNEAVASTTDNSSASTLNKTVKKKDV